MPSGSSSKGKIKELHIYTDGGARGNPGPAGCGVVMIDPADDQIIYEADKYLGTTTNNQAEYEGVILALQEAAQHFEVQEIVLHSDSELLVKQLNGEYKVKNPGLQEKFSQVIKLMKKFPAVFFKHVRREQNKRADQLANLAMNRKGN